MRHWMGIAAICTLALPCAAQNPPKNTAPPTPASAPSLADVELGANDELYAIIAVRRGSVSLGEIEVRLHHGYATRHVKNFVRLAERGFYDGTLFHRVQAKNFIQGGDPLSKDADPANDGTGGPGYSLPPETNDKKHTRGAVAMAAMGNQNSGSQFFIDLTDKPAWDGKYTVFGHVSRGIEVADQVGSAKLEGERPVEPHRMTVRVEKRTRKLKL